MEYFYFFSPSPWDRDWIGLRVMMVLSCGGVTLVMICSARWQSSVQRG